MKKDNTEIVRCYDCSFAYLMQSLPVNPIVAECTETGERNVASTMFRCKFFKRKENERTTNKMKKL